MQKTKRKNLTTLKRKKKITNGIVYINATFNNTLVTNVFLTEKSRKLQFIISGVKVSVELIIKGPLTKRLLFIYKE